MILLLETVDKALSLAATLEVKIGSRGFWHPTDPTAYTLVILLPQIEVLVGGGGGGEGCGVSKGHGGGDAPFFPPS